jgi:hypothetical protein
MDQQKNVKNKRLCEFNVEWKKNYEWAIEVASDKHRVKCFVCNTVFSCGTMGVSSLVQHANTTCHKTAAKKVSQNKIMQQFLVPTNSKQEEIVIIAELAQIFHTVKHNHSYNSIDCSLKLNAQIYGDSKVDSSKISCGRTKAAAIVQNVLGPNSLYNVLKELHETDPPIYFCVQTDASNHKNRKMFPFSIRYFTRNAGIQNKLLDFSENSDESADGMFLCLDGTMKKCSLDWMRLSGFSGDNTNANFGKHHSLFTNILIENADVNKSNCHPHMIGNAAKHACQQLEFDIENFLMKTFGHFSVSAKRRQSLIEVYEFCDFEFKEILRHVPTRWLSLLPCIDRVLRSWDALSKYYIDRIKKLPKQIYKAWHLNEDSTEIPEKVELYLLFASQALELFHNAIIDCEGNDVSSGEVFKIMSDLRNCLQNRFNKKYFGFLVSQRLKYMDENSVNNLTVDFCGFYKSAIDYIEKRFDFNSDSRLAKLSKICLTNNLCPDFNDLVEVMNDLKILKKLQINVDKMFEEHCILEEVLKELVKIEAYKKCSSSASKWHYILKDKPYFVNIFKIISYVMSLPATSCYTERVFSVMNAKWSPDRNRCSTELMKSELMVYFNYDYSCQEFSGKIKTDRDLLKRAKSRDKYVYNQ